MRQERTVQANVVEIFAAHEIGHELKAMSQWLDEHRDLIGLVARDLVRVDVKATGQQGLPAEAVLRCCGYSDKGRTNEEAEIHGGTDHCCGSTDACTTSRDVPQVRGPVSARVVDAPVML